MSADPAIVDRTHVAIRRAERDLKSLTDAERYEMFHAVASSQQWERLVIFSWKGDDRELNDLFGEIEAQAVAYMLTP